MQQTKKLESIFPYLTEAFDKRSKVESYEMFDLEFAEGYRQQYLLSINSQNYIGISKVTVSEFPNHNVSEVEKRHPGYVVF